jgi:hypothetical protein
MPFDERGKAHLQDFQLMATYVVSHPRFLELVEELADSEDIYDEARRDPKQHLRKKGFELRDNWTFEISRNSPTTLSGCVTIEGTAYCFTYTLPSISFKTIPGV